MLRSMASDLGLDNLLRPVYLNTKGKYSTIEYTDRQRWSLSDYTDAIFI